MKCEDIKALYDDFKSNMLTEDQHKSVNDHIKECYDCNDYFLQNNKLTMLLDNWDGIEPQSNYVSKFWSRIDEEEMNQDKGLIRFFKGIKTGFLVPSLAVAIFCSLIIVNVYRTSTVNTPLTEQDVKDNRLLLEINDIISFEGSEPLQIYGLWNDLEEEPKEG